MFFSFFLNTQVIDFQVNCNVRSLDLDFDIYVIVKLFNMYYKVRPGEVYMCQSFVSERSSIVSRDICRL